MLRLFLLVLVVALPACREFRPFGCSGRLVETLPLNVQGMDFNSDFPNRRDYGEAENCESAAGSEAVYRVEMVAGQTMTVAVHRGSLRVNVRRDCSPQTECLETTETYRQLNQPFGRHDFTADSDGIYVFTVEAGARADLGEVVEYQFIIGEFSDEVCTDGVDNDLDGLEDCDDLRACFDTDACPFTCPVAEPDHAPLMFVNNTATLSASVFDDVAADVGPYSLGDGCADWEGGSSVMAGGKALVYELELEAGENVVVRDSSEADLLWRVLRDCAPFTPCLVNEQVSRRIGELYKAEVAETVFLVVQGIDVETPQRFDAGVSIGTPETCADGLDEDLDGLVDCNDFDCLGTPDCPFHCAAIDITTDLVGNGIYTLSGTSFASDFPREPPSDWSERVGIGCLEPQQPSATFSVDLEVGEGVSIAETTGAGVAVSAAASCLPGAECIFSSYGFSDFGYVRASFVAPEAGTYTLSVEPELMSTAIDEYAIVIELLPMETCDNGVDDNEDGNTDCFDVGCDCFQECPLVQSLPIRSQGEDFAAVFSDVRNFINEEGCSAGPVRDVDGNVDAVFTVGLDMGQGLVVRETGFQEVTIRVLDHCSLGSTCLAVDSANTQELRFIAPETGEYTVVIEQAGWSSPFDILIDTFEDEDCPDGPNQTLDGIDNDLDGATDCFDTDCYDEVLCPVECTDVQSPRGPIRESGDDWFGDFTETVDFGLAADCWLGGGTAASYQFALTEGDRLRLASLVEFGFRLHVREGCSPASACVATAGSRLPTIEFVAPADGVYTATVQSDSALSRPLDYSFVIQVVEE